MIKMKIIYDKILDTKIRKMLNVCPINIKIIYCELLYKLATIEVTRSTSMCPLVTHKNNMTRLDAQLLSYYSILFSYSVISLMRNKLRCQLFLI